MRRAVQLALAAAIATIVVPAAAYRLMAQDDNDPMAETLRGFGFVRVPLPSNLMNVGSLYYVDAGLRDFKTTCHVGKAELGDDVIVSRSENIEENLQRNGLFATNVTVNFGSLVKGALDANFVHKLHFSLTDVVVEELPLDRSSLIYRKLMEERACNDVALEFVNDAPRGYVCQVQKTLKATAEFKLDRDVQNKLEANANVSDITDKIKLAIETQSDVNVVERDGRLFTGSALTYGVSMNPTCLAPLRGLFQRTLPRNRFDRLVNFVKFDILEPLWPANPTQAQLARYSQIADKRQD